MNKVNAVNNDGITGSLIQTFAEQGNHKVILNGWHGVASHLTDEFSNVEGTLVWFPGVTITELKK